MTSSISGPSPTESTGSTTPTGTAKTEGNTSISLSGLPTPQADASMIGTTLAEASKAAEILSPDNGDQAGDVSSDEETTPEDETAIQADDQRKGDSSSSDGDGSSGGGNSSGGQGELENAISDHESTSTSNNPLVTVTPLSSGPQNISGSANLEAALNKQMANNLSEGTQDIVTSSNIGKMQDIAVFSQSIAQSIPGSTASLAFMQTNVGSLVEDMKNNPIGLSPSTLSVASAHFNKANEMITNAHLSTSDAVTNKLSQAASGQIGLGFKAIFTEMLSNPSQIQAALSQTLSHPEAAVFTHVIKTASPDAFSKLAVSDILTKSAASTTNGVSVETSSPSTNQMASILAAFGVAVSTDAVVEAEFSSNQSVWSGTQASFNAAQSQAEAAQQLASIKHEQHEEAKAKKTGNILKWVTVAVMCVAIVALTVTTFGAGASLAAALIPSLMILVMAGSLAGTVTGHSGFVINQLALGLREIPGSTLSKQDSELIASISVAIIAMVCTGGIGAAGIAAGSAVFASTGGFTDLGELTAEAAGGGDNAAIAWVVAFNVVGMVLSMGSGMMAARSVAQTAATAAKEGSAVAGASDVASEASADTTQMAQASEDTTQMATITKTVQAEGMEMSQINDTAETATNYSSDLAEGNSSSVSASQSNAQSVQTGSQAASNAAQSSNTLSEDAMETIAEENTALPGGITAVSDDETITTGSLLKSVNASLQEMTDQTKAFILNFGEKLSSLMGYTRSSADALTEDVASDAKTVESTEKPATFFEKLKAATPTLTKVFAAVQVAGNITEGALSAEMGVILSHLSSTQRSLGTIEAVLDEIKSISERTLTLSNQITQNYETNSTGLQTALNSMTQQEALGANMLAQGLQQNIA